MSTTYKTKPGDTFELIARKVYGSEQYSEVIAAANPGTLEPFSASVNIIVPVLPGAPQNSPSAAASGDVDEVAILIDGIRFRFWHSLMIRRELDAPDTIQLLAPFDSGEQSYRDTFKPFSYKPLSATVGGVPLFTGTMIGVSPELSQDAAVVAINGYSLPGVLNDCVAPSSSFPVEFNGQTLREIATTLARPFGVSVDFLADPGAAFSTVAIGPTERVSSFLAKLATQRNLVTASTERGALLFWQSAKVGSPVAVLSQGASPVTGISTQFNPQNYYSHITGIEPVKVGAVGSQYTAKNSRLNGVIRPITFIAPDVLGGELRSATLSKAGRMFGNVAAFTVSVATWRDPQGELWAPNTTVTLNAPDAMIYSDYEFVIRTVDFIATADSKTAVLNLVMPGAFNGEIPESLPWDG